MKMPNDSIFKVIGTAISPSNQMWDAFLDFGASNFALFRTWILQKNKEEINFYLTNSKNEQKMQMLITYCRWHRSVSPRCVHLRCFVSVDKFRFQGMASHRTRKSPTTVLRTTKRPISKSVLYSATIRWTAIGIQVCSA